MSQIADFTLYDGGAAHALKAISVSKDKGKITALYREGVSGVPVEAQGTVTVSEETLKSGVHKVDIQIATPVMEAVNGQNAAGYTAAPKIAHIPRIVITGYFAGRTSATDRMHLRMMAANFLNGVITNATVNYAHAASDAIDQLACPT